MFEIKTASQCLYRSGIRIYRNQGTLYFRNLGERPAFHWLLCQPDNISRRDHFRNLGQLITDTVYADILARPLDATPWQAYLAAIFQHRDRRTVIFSDSLGCTTRCWCRHSDRYIVIHRQDQCGNKTPVIIIILQYIGQRRLAPIACLGSCLSISRRGFCLGRIGRQIHITHHATETVTFIICNQPIPDTVIGRALQALIDRGIHIKTTYIGLITELLNDLGTCHLVDIWRVHAQRAAVAFSCYRCICMLFIFRRGNEIELMHTRQYIVTTDGGTLGIDDWIIGRRCFWQAGDHRDLCQGQLIEVHTIIDLCCSGYTIGTVAEIDLVEVQLEDLLLIQLTLYLQCQQDLVQFTQVSLLTAEVEVACQLHGDSGTTLTAFTGQHQVDHGTQDTLIVDTGVFEEAVIFG